LAVISLIDVAVVEPKYQMNLGYIARVMKNFGVEHLYLINPRCDRLGKQAIKYSKHAHDVLEHALVRRGIAEAAKGAFVIGTTGLWGKTDGSFHNVYTLQSAGRLLRRVRASNRRILLLIGRDDIGLTKEELRECDATIFIGADKAYPVLNISHALAIMLYELTSEKYLKEYGFMSELYADAKSQRMALTLFKRIVESNPHIRDKKSVVMAFGHMLGRSVPTRKEINAISIALAGKS
jgi:TrmH family RNA methyltransferase